MPAKAPDEVERWDLAGTGSGTRVDLQLKIWLLTPTFAQSTTAALADRLLPHPVLITAIPIPPKAVRKHKNYRRQPCGRPDGLAIPLHRQRHIVVWLYGGPLLRGSRPLELILRDAERPMTTGKWKQPRRNSWKPGQLVQQQGLPDPGESGGFLAREMVAAQQAALAPG